MTTVNEFYVSVKVDDLGKDRERWESNEYLASNKVLYGLLAECMTLAAEIAKNRKLQLQLENVLSVYKIPVTAGTPLITKVIKLVFGKERRRASAYSLAVRVAKKAEVTPEQLPNWLTEQGGVEEVRTSAAREGGETPAVRREQNRSKGETWIETLETLSTVVKTADTPEEVGPTLLLGYVAEDRTTSVRCFVDNETLVNAALVFVGKEAEEAGQVDGGSNNDVVTAAVDDPTGGGEAFDEEAA